MDGFQVCREVGMNERLKRVAFIFYTAMHTDPEDKEFALNQGERGSLSSPQSRISLLRY